MATAAVPTVLTFPRHLRRQSLGSNMSVLDGLDRHGKIGAPQPEKKALAVSGAGRRTVAVCGRRRQRIPAAHAADDVANCGRPGRQRRPEPDPGDGADICTRQSAVRLCVITTAGPVDSIAALEARQCRSRGRAQRRGDARRHRVGRHPAQERRRAVGAAAAAQGRRRRAPNRRSRRSAISPAIASAWSAGPRSTSRCCASS